MANKELTPLEELVLWIMNNSEVDNFSRQMVRQDELLKKITELHRRQ